MAQPVEIEYKKNHVEFRLSNKPEYLCKMDVEDFLNLVVGTSCWFVHLSKAAKTARPYVRRSVNIGGKCISQHLHRMVMNCGEYDPYSSVTDHINGDSLDNRKGNLRIGDTELNMSNRRDSLMDYKGIRICWIPTRSKYQAYKKKKYYGSSVCLDKLKRKIDQKLMGEEQCLHQTENAI